LPIRVTSLDASAMKCVAVVSLAIIGTLGHCAELRGAGAGGQPIYHGGSVDNNDDFAISASRPDMSKIDRPPGYRNAWDDCHGVGASATERTRVLAAKIKGWAKPIPFVRHAAQDCDTLDGTGTKPGPGERVNYPGPEIPARAHEGLEKAADTLEKYPADVKKPAKYVGYLYHDN